jgi:hypothetical protein
MNKTTPVLLVFSILTLMLLTGCGGSSNPAPTPRSPARLSSDNVNLIFVVSEDLAYHASGDINSKTANLTNQGLQRSLRMATFLQVLGAENVTSIYALEPMTHLQKPSHLPDMVGLETVQQFALLNQITLSSDLKGGTPHTGQSYPLKASYSAESIPIGVPAPSPFCLNCQGLDFNDREGDNEAVATGIVEANFPGFYVFSAPWETTSALMANINELEGYNLTLPASYQDPNYIYIYAISITPSKSASPGHLRQQYQSAFHLPCAASAEAGQRSMRTAGAFQHHRDWR